jgi:hypothetical protein
MVKIKFRILCFRIATEVLNSLLTRDPRIAALRKQTSVAAITLSHNNSPSKPRRIAESRINLGEGEGELPATHLGSEFGKFAKLEQTVNPVCHREQNVNAIDARKPPADQGPTRRLSPSRVHP